MFVATAGHELRTPMNGVVGFTELLAQTALTEEQSYYVDMIQESANALLAIIEDLLEYSKLKIGAGSPRHEELDIRNVVDDVVKLVRVTPDGCGLQINSWVDPVLPGIVLGYPARLRQVLLNLVANAAAFTPEGKVEVTVKPGAHPGRIRFEVTDTGIGIASDHLPKLFRPFSQLSSARRRSGGTGLGLAICKRLVEEMPNGIIGVSSIVGIGSTFWFETDLPVVNTCPPSYAHKTLAGAA